MTASILKPGTANELKRICGMLASSIGESLGSLVGRELVVRPGEPEVHEAAALLKSMPRPVTVTRGALDQAYAGRTMLVLLELPDSVAMAGLLMMTPDDVIQQRRGSGELADEDATAFGELGNVMFAGFAGVLRDGIGNCEVRYRDYVVARPEDEPGDCVGTGTLVALPFRLKLGEYPESRGCVVVDAATAESWNKAPLTPLADAGTARGGTRSDEETLESIPAAPIRGTLAAFVMQPEVFRPLRMSCRRVGLELRRHGRGEIPNPAAHRHEIVLMDVPPGEDRRFDWCRRIKELSDSTRVVLLIHHPSRHRVMQAFMARADAILGFPCDEPQLSQKLGAVLDQMPPALPPS
jgi:CheY-like chemotaxis protein